VAGYRFPPGVFNSAYSGNLPLGLPEKQDVFRQEKGKKTSTTLFFIDLFPFGRFLARRAVLEFTLAKGIEGAGFFAQFTSKDSHGFISGKFLKPFPILL
jgi:hypothetical protein